MNGIRPDADVALFDERDGLLHRLGELEPHEHHRQPSPAQCRRGDLVARNEPLRLDEAEAVELQKAARVGRRRVSRDSGGQRRRGAGGGAGAAARSGLMRLIWRTVPLPWTSRDAVVKPPLDSAHL